MFGFVIRTLLMALGVAAVLWIFRVRSAHARHRAWTAMLAAMLVLPFWSIWGPKIEAVPVPMAAEEFEPSFIVPAHLSNANAPTGTLAAPVPDVDWERIALMVYAMGAVLMLIRLGAGTALALQLRTRSRKVDCFLESSQCSAPVTVGWVKPVVLLPEGWKEWPHNKLDAVLAHEGEHVRRRDPLVHWLALLNRCIFWFDPVAWWLERQLSALAEEACDAAAISRGHSPCEYSQYLIELSKAVGHSHSRIALRWGSAMDGDGISSRVRRILSSVPGPRLSRTRATAVSLLCGCILIAFAACTAKRTAAGQPTEAEMQRARWLKNQQWKKDQALTETSHHLTTEQAAALETAVKANPGDADRRLELVRYYQYKVDVKGLDALTLWFIEHHPEQWTEAINPAWDPDGYKKGRELWLAKLQRADPSPETYERAAVFLEAGDRPLAEQVLVRGQQAFPNPNWTGHLGEHYGRAIFDTSTSAAYASSARRKLEATTDPHLLTVTAYGVYRWGLSNNHGEFPDREAIALADHYIDRALELQPDYAHARLLKLDIADLQLVARQRAGPLSESDRMKYLRYQVQHRPGNIQGVEAQAHELLALLSKYPREAEIASEVFFTDLSLGEAALGHGDRRKAVDYLLAASRVTPDERLRWGNVDATLARKLVDAGERDAVAFYLERCAKFNVDSVRLSGWAAQIRKGINPDLFPYHS